MHYETKSDLIISKLDNLNKTDHYRFQTIFKVIEELKDISLRPVATLNSENNILNQVKDELTTTIATPQDIVAQIPIPAFAESCQWKFIKYTPSAYEQYWTENVATLQHDVCAASNRQLEEVNEWTKQTSSEAPHDFTTNIFSKFTFQNKCTGEITTDYIEPLAGLTRSPLYCLRGNAYVVSKDYLVVSWNISKKLSGPPDRTPKAFYFDLGASLYDSGKGGSSQSWFVETYESRGIHWDGIFAWEAQEHRPSKAWGLIPARLKPVYHWYNIPVSPVPGDADNALDYIRRTARPEDYVLLKIDIDTTPVEEALVEQILASDELLGLIDEFYFEHHVNTRPMYRHWGNLSVSWSLADTYRIFTALRSKGVIAHSWV